MKNHHMLTGAVALVLLTCSCSTKVRVTNQNQPGPKVGNAVGAGVGAVAGNVAGGVVGVGEGSVAAVGDVFDPKPTRVVRSWTTEETPDGRTILVPHDYLVDEYGRVIKEIKPGTAF